MLHNLQGQRFGKYLVGELLGEGGFSWVYRATDLETRQDVALKIFKGFFPDQESLDELRDQERIAQELRHPHIVAVHRFAVEGTAPYVVMDYLPFSWRDEYAIGEPLPLDLVVRYTTQLADALQYAHDQRVVHRDLKPANLLLTAQRDVMLTDFGIARVLTPKGVDYTKHVAGTLHYMAPEAFQGEIGRACDQYSLGVMVYEWLTGKPPFEGNQAELLHKHFQVAPESLRVSMPGISKEVDEVVLKALAKKPFQRFISVHTFAVKLEAAAFPGGVGHQASSGPAASRSGVQSPGRKQSGWAGAGQPAQPATPAANARPAMEAAPVLRALPEVEAQVDPGASTELAPVDEALVAAVSGAIWEQGTVAEPREAANMSPPMAPAQLSMELPVFERPGSLALPQDGRGSGVVEPVKLEPLHFRAFYPKEVAVESWNTLLVYTHIAAALGAVQEDAGRLKLKVGERQREAAGMGARPMKRGAELTIVPQGEGLRFNPERLTFTWWEDWHRAAFRFWAEPGCAGLGANAEIVIYAGPLLLAVVKMSVFCEGMPLVGGRKREEVEAAALSYDRIFTSYSHTDTRVVQACRNVYQSLGIDVLIDQDSLRAGEDFNKALMRMIDQADIFQLFWSQRSAASAYVRKEWEYALTRGKGDGFIRPVYWEIPLAPPPVALGSIHFKYIDLPKLPDAVNAYEPAPARVSEVVCFRCEAANPPESRHCGGCGYDLSGKRAEHDRALGPSGRPYNARFSMMSGTLIGRHFTLHQDVTKIGRTSDNDVCIPDPTVSRVHATLWFEDGRWLLEDLGSHNGTFIGGVRARTHVPQPLADGAQLRFGDEVVLFQVVG